MTNIRAAAKIVRPLPKPGARFELEISEPLGLQTWSVDENKCQKSARLQGKNRYTMPAEL